MGVPVVAIGFTLAIAGPIVAIVATQFPRKPKRKIFETEDFIFNSRITKLSNYAEKYFNLGGGVFKSVNNRQILDDDELLIFNSFWPDKTRKFRYLFVIKRKYSMILIHI
ncbi:hypothetical protein [Metamycoplasma equirhinis]|uniref:hypothetical protein n=1 Tax=Metamycoplasma equirhinis TaxID=92402 RepID=UPI003594191E